jgi:retron-type reverse transcriptase
MRDVSDMLNIKELICIDIIFIDASNAFDSVPHNELLKELQSIGIFGVFLKLLVDYFTNRFQYVKYDNFNSFLYEVMSGVLQGGVLSPILYNIFVRNFPLVLKYSKPFQFADDTAIIKGILSENDLNNFQIDIYEISKWFESKGLTINASKTKHLRISFRNIQLKT